MELIDLYTLVLQAENRIRPYIVETPVITNEEVDAQSGKSIYFKCENLQKTGVFKARGALNAVFAHLEKDPSLKGVVTHSSGNHGQALAWAAKRCGIACTVVVPEGTPIAKVRLIQKYGATVVLCEPTPTARKETCHRISEEEGKVEVPPYDDLLVIAGQGTMALEFFRQANLDMVLVPISGGGMTSGISIVAAKDHPNIEVCAVQPQGKDLEQSLKEEKRLWPNPPKFLPTIAEGIRIQQVGDITFPIMCKYTSKNVWTVTDEQMINAMKFGWENLKMVIEVSSAPGLAVVLSEEFKKNPAKRVGVILCGGNCSIEQLPWQ